MEQLCIQVDGLWYRVVIAGADPKRNGAFIYVAVIGNAPYMVFDQSEVQSIMRRVGK